VISRESFSYAPRRRGNAAAERVRRRAVAVTGSRKASASSAAFSGGSFAAS
jgi:hypothetical protein